MSWLPPHEGSSRNGVRASLRGGIDMYLASPHGESLCNGFPHKESLCDGFPTYKNQCLLPYPARVSGSCLSCFYGILLAGPSGSQNLIKIKFFERETTPPGLRPGAAVPSSSPAATEH